MLINLKVKIHNFQYSFQNMNISQENFHFNIQSQKKSVIFHNLKLCSSIVQGKRANPNIKLFMIIFKHIFIYKILSFKLIHICLADITQSLGGVSVCKDGVESLQHVMTCISMVFHICK